MAVEAEQVTVEVVTAEVVVATVDEVVELVTEPAAVRKGGQKQKRVVTPFEGETLPGGERTKFLPRTTKDYFKLHPVPQIHSYSWHQRSTIVDWRCQEYKPKAVPKCRPWAMDTISDSSPAGKVHSRRTDEALGRLASRDKRLHLSTSHRGGQDPRCASKAELDERRVDPVIDEAVKVVSTQAVLVLLNICLQELLELKAVQEMQEDDKVFLSRVFTVPKTERGREYGRRFILNLKVSLFHTYQDLDRTALFLPLRDPTLSVLRSQSQIS